MTKFRLGFTFAQTYTLMKVVIHTLILLLISHLTVAQTLLSEDFQSYQGFGETPTNGWTTSSSGYRVYIRTIPGGQNVKICEINLNQNKTGDSLITPTFGPLTENAVLTFKSRIIDSYIGSSALFNHIPAPGDVVSAFVSQDGATYQFLQDLLPSYPTGNDLTFTNFSVPITGFEGSSVKVKLKTTRSAGEWYPSFDDFVATNVTAKRQIQNSNDFSLVPNPGSGQITLLAPNYSNKTTVEVFNILGTKVYETNLLANKAQLDLENLKTGIYLVKLTEGKITSVKRLILK